MSTEELYKSGIRDGKLYVFGDFKYGHGIFIILGAPIILFLICCHTITFIKSYRAFYGYQTIKSDMNKVTSDNDDNNDDNEDSRAESTTKTHYGDQKPGRTSVLKRNKPKLEFPATKDKKKLGIYYYFIWIVHILLLMALFIGGINLIFSSIVYCHWNLFNLLKTRCNILMSVIVSCMLYIKTSLYFIGILRIITTFKGSSFQYSKKFLWCISIYIFITSLANHISVFIFGNGILLDGSKGDYYFCQYSFNFAYTMIYSINDVLIQLVLLILFMKPLVGLTLMQSIKNKRITTVMTKYLLLVLTAIISSGLTGISFFFGLASSQILDSSINLLCIVLMSVVHYKYYVCLCSIPHKFIESRWKTNMKIKSTRNLSSTVQI